MSHTRELLHETDLTSSPLVREQEGRFLLCDEDCFPNYPEINSLGELRDPEAVSSRLQGIDWSFTSDDTRFLTHDLHPYPAKFIPQIPGHCISQLSLRGDLVLDPFGGSGTTALEAIRIGRRAMSIDANHVGTLIGRVKTCNFDHMAASDLQSLRSVLATLLTDLPSPNLLCEQYCSSIPNIPNIEKWFPITSTGELAVIRSRIASMDSECARDIALLSLSRIILSVSFQDAETRYASRPREIPQGETFKRFLLALDDIVDSIMRTQAALRYGVSEFVTADTRTHMKNAIRPDSIDLIVTSPPYGNAYDYHLYHRFRLLWIGHDPRELARVEIGSHLRHQRDKTGFTAYLQDMSDSLEGMFRVLKAGRYATIVVGDPIYDGVQYSAADAINEVATDTGLEAICVIPRPIHGTKRSIIAAGRRATIEQIIILRKPPMPVSLSLYAPPYKLWPYEKVLRQREIKATLNTGIAGKSEDAIELMLDPYDAAGTRRLVFTHGIGVNGKECEPTWQAILENGFASEPSARKDPRYVTHGLHPYKGKFYPQLAKALMNLVDLPDGAMILDPFCGSGTTLLEGYLNGFRSFGCDLNPLAAKIARAKVGILDINPSIVREALRLLVEKIRHKSPNTCEDVSQFPNSCIDEIFSWFPKPVVYKMNWLLGAIRSVSDGVVRDFLEVIFSSIVRDISQQDPNDLRIRRRTIPLEDADLFGMYVEALETQYLRIQKFWSVRGHSPSRFHRCHVIEGDSRSACTFHNLGLVRNSVDLVLTSPPYATALPYIDTDRLSLLVLFGMNSSARRPVEQQLIGSREIVTSERRKLEDAIVNSSRGLPPSVGEYLLDLQIRVDKAEVGFRRKNMPALLHRFFLNMAAVLENCFNIVRQHGEAMVVIGDNRICVETEYERIATTDFVADIARSVGFELIERIDITVTTEGLVHLRNAITENAVLRLRK